MSVAREGELRRFTHLLAEIGHTLECSDRPGERVQRVLVLLRKLVPFRLGAVLASVPDAGQQLFTTVELPQGERDELERVLTATLQLLATDEDVELTGRDRRHLSLPLLGLDEMMGVVRLEAEDGEGYDAEQLRILSVVAAQLGAYLAMMKLQHHLEVRTTELTAAYAFQQRLVGIASHDLRNPLAVITVVASTMKKKTDDPKRVEALERALRCAQRATRIINDLLDVTHSQVTGGFPVSHKRVDLRVLVSDALDELRTANPDRTIHLLPDGNEPLVGEWDPDRAVQVVVNLVSNALAHGDEGSAVTLTLRGSASEVTLSVHNHGEPIASSLLPLIFDPFKRGPHGVRRAGGGLGLGLYIVHQIALSHGGEVSVRSDATAGTTFEVKLPRWHGRHAGAALQAAGKTILVVDDDADARGALVEMLEDAGHRVIAAANGQQAIELLRGGLRPALVLLDLNMPVMDGEAFYEACLGDPALRTIPVFAVSSDAVAAIALHRKGAAGYLKKPIDVLALQRLIDAEPG